MKIKELVRKLQIVTDDETAAKNNRFDLGIDVVFVGRDIPWTWERSVNCHVLKTVTNSVVLTMSFDCYQRVTTDNCL